MIVSGSVLDAANAQASATGGLGSVSGQAGRVVLGGNTNGANAPSVGGGTQVSAAGSRSVNAYTSGGLVTPYIPDLKDGAETFGLLDGLLATDPLFDFITGASAPANAFAAGVQMDLGVGAYADDFVDYDLFLFLNLTDQAISNPMFGSGSMFETALQIGGWTRSVAFGGSGDETLLELGGYEIWATLVEESDNQLNFSGNGQFSSFFTTGAQTSVGYLTTTVSAVPLPAPLLLLLSGFGALRLVRRQRKSA